MTRESKGPQMTPFTEPTGNVVGAGDFRTDGIRAVLNTTRCRACGTAWFPARTQCAACASGDMTPEPSADTGTVYASTVVRIGPARFSAPYVLTYTDIGDIRVLAHYAGDSAPAPGTPVQLRLTVIGSDDNGPVMSYGVAPTTQGANL